MLLSDKRRSAGSGSGFSAWRRSRPFIGSILAVVSGFEIFFSGQLDLGNIHVQLGIEGFQATVIPIALVLLGLLAMFMPAHHVFYGVLTLVVGVYSLIGVNLGGFVVGMLLACIGGILIVAWMPRSARAQAAGADTAETDAAEDDGPAPLRRVRVDPPTTTDAAA